MQLEEIKRHQGLIDFSSDDPEHEDEEEPAKSSEKPKNPTIKAEKLEAMPNMNNEQIEAWFKFEKPVFNPPLERPAQSQSVHEYL